MTLLIVIALVALLAFGAPIFAVMIGFALLGASDSPRDLMIEFNGQLVDLLRIGTGEPATVLSTIPLFIFAGYLMAEAKTADRLVRFSQALVGWLPGGLAVVTIFACAIFTTFTGASGVTIVALGSLIMPALIKQNYPQRFSLGLVCGTGSVGLLFPPALPLFVYGTIYGIAAQMSVNAGTGDMKLIPFSTDSFLFAGIVPGIVLIGMLSIYAVVVAIKVKVPRQKFELGELGRSFVVALPEIIIPLLIIVSLAKGWLLIPETAALTAIYVFLLEAVVYRDIRVKQLWAMTRESMSLVGAIFIIIFAASALTNYFVTAQIPNDLVDWMEKHIQSKWGFLLMLNLILLFVGMIMDIFSAIVVVVPLITPAAIRYGIDPYHLGVVFLLNLEIGYLTPPVGLNLFITSFKFERPIIDVVRASMPFLLIMLVALGVVTYVPSLTVIPPPERRGRLSELVKMVQEAKATLGQVNEIAMPDGKKLKPADCDLIEDDLNKTFCKALFKEYTACASDPATQVECEKKAIGTYLEDTAEPEEEVDADAGAEEADAGQ